MKRLPSPVLALLMIFVPVIGTAQITEARPVAVMPFTGEEDEINNQFRNAVSIEIQNLAGNFLPSSQDFPLGVDPLDIPPDEPPPAEYLGSEKFVVTGASFPDAGEHHLQVWLWDVEEPTLIYTDELVCEEIEDADEFMPLLIEWIFSHIVEPDEDDGMFFDDDDGSDTGIVSLPPLEPEETPAKGRASTRPAFEDEDKWFHLGGRVGASTRFYRMADNFLLGQALFIDDQSRLSLNFEGAFQAAIQLWPVLSVQGEIMFTMDYVKFQAYTLPSQGQSTVESSTIQYSSMSLMFPVIAKVTLRPIPFLIAPFAGVYFILPLGNITMSNSYDNYTSSFSYSHTMPLGITGGITLGMKLGQIRKGWPGVVFMDIRYSKDLGALTYERPIGNNTEIVSAFNRNMLSITLGYEIGLVNRDIKTTKR